MAFSPPPLYPIVNVRSDDAAEIERARRLASALAEGGVTLLQVRAKTLGTGAYTELAADIVERLVDLGCKLIVNDRADVAMAAGAAGVHVGDEDLPVDEARALLGPEAIIGYSTHSLDDVAKASARASYLGFGPVFESPTKAGVREPRGLGLLRDACRASKLPVVAIGGITLARAPAVQAAGAASCAVISEIEAASDVGSLVRAWLEGSRGTKP
jgi:thiamine-phosphate pyrophosphorylase